MNVKPFVLRTAIAAMVIGGVAACKSTVTLDDMRKQQADALSQLEDTREELLELSEMKEKFTVDYREERIEALEKKRKQIDKDISSIQDVETASAESGKKDMIKSLERQRKDLERDITNLRKMNKEDWSSARDSINRKINALQEVVANITENLNEFEVEDE